MVFQIFAIIAGLSIGWLRRGSIWYLTNLSLKWVWGLPVAYIFQYISIRYFRSSIYEISIILSYVLLLAFCFRNLRVFGVAWTAAGTLSNFLVMAANGFRMPAYLPPIEQIDKHLVLLLRLGQVGKSVAMTKDTNLNFLGDIFFLKIQPPTLISIGDILFAIGLAILIQAAMQPRKESVVGVFPSVLTD